MWRRGYGVLPAQAHERDWPIPICLRLLKVAGFGYTLQPMAMRTARISIAYRGICPGGASERARVAGSSSPARPRGPPLGHSWV